MSLQVVFLAAAMLLTGSLNTIATKLQDGVVVGLDEHGEQLFFKHPVVQTAFMFAGESLCLIPYLIVRLVKQRSSAQSGRQPESKDLRRTIAAFSLPALCDAGATTLLNLGLYYTYASVFQMLRGTLVIFAGGLTVAVLKRRLRSHNYLGIVLIAAGAALVGASSLLYGADDRAAGGKHASSAPNPLLGDVLVILAQFLNALQFIVEERFLLQYKAPVLLAVGTEGTVGLILSAVALPLLTRLQGQGGAPIDDAAAALRQIGASAVLQWTTAATVASIALFNFCGVSVTKHLSGASRAAIDACRTAIIWLFCLRMGWERFHMLQVVGFAVLISGTSVYNDILRSFMPAADTPPRSDRGASRTAGGHPHGTAAGAAAAQDVEQALLDSSSDDDDSIDALRGLHPRRVSVRLEDSQGRERVVTFGEATPRLPLHARSSAIATSGQHRPSRSQYSMARSVTMLPQALSPHSLASVPSSAWQFESAPSADGERSLQAELGSSSEEEGGESSGSESEAVTVVPQRG